MDKDDEDVDEIIKILIRSLGWELEKYLFMSSMAGTVVKILNTVYKVLGKPMDVEELRNALRSIGTNKAMVELLKRSGKLVDRIDESGCIYVLQCSAWGSGYRCILFDPVTNEIVAKKARKIVGKILKVLTSDVEIRYVPTTPIRMCIG